MVCPMMSTGWPSTTTAPPNLWGEHISASDLGS